MKPERIEVLGVPVDCVDMARAVAFVEESIEERRVVSILAVNPEKVIKAQSDATVMRLLRNAGLLIPDGIGVVVAARLFGLGKMRRVPGAELMPKICELAARRGYKVFLFGASPEVNARAIQHLRASYPGLDVAGNQHGFVLEHEVPELLDRINASGAQILFVALGSPRQEIWIEKYAPRLNVNVFQGVGGTFDVLSGSVKRAPWLFRKANLEWFYRLVTQPKRLLRQTALPKFAYQVLARRVAR